MRTLVVVGGDAAGMSAAATAKKLLGDELEVIVFERGDWTSYSACGIPYWVAGRVAGPDALVARTPEQHREHGIDVRTGTEVVAVDVGARTVRTADGAATRWDELVLATGAEPVRPDLPGIDAAGIFGVQDLGDGARILEALERQPRRAVVVGSGYIGLEMAEACVERGLATTVVEQAPAPMPQLDGELGARVHVAMSGLGIDVRTETPVRGFAAGADGRVSAVRTAAGDIPADIVFLGLGVRARSALAGAAGLPLGVAHAVVVDDTQRVRGHEHVWAAGDCVATTHRITGAQVHIALGTHANKQGVVAGKNIAGGDMRFRGVLGTAITKVCGLEVSLTGLSAAQAGAAGRDAVRASIDSTTTAGYYPGAQDMTVVMVAERGSRRILGAQIVGGAGSAKRIDTVAAALWCEMTVDDLVACDLSYAPPFSPVWDPVQVAARVAARELAR